jgi:putative proteasome-type protease
MLELAVHAKVDLAAAVKIALSSMISTSRANLSVGPPYDVGIYLPGAHALDHFRVVEGSPALVRLERFWSERLVEGMNQLPAISPADFESDV